MNIIRTPYLSEMAITTHIESENNNKTMSKFQADQTEGLERSGIKRKGRKSEKQVQ